MEYYFYNNDADSLRGNRRTHILIKQGIAITGGPSSYGEQLRQLSVGDTLLMYENGIGIVAVGEVKEPWDGKAYKELIYYVSGESYLEPEREYRIKVKWFLNLIDKPIMFQDLKERIGYQPRGAIRKIVKCKAEVEDMIAKRQSSKE